MVGRASEAKGMMKTVTHKQDFTLQVGATGKRPIHWGYKSFVPQSPLFSFNYFIEK